MNRIKICTQRFSSGEASRDNCHHMFKKTYWEEIINEKVTYMDKAHHRFKTKYKCVLCSSLADECQAFLFEKVN